MIDYDNDDAIADANRYAGKVVDMSTKPLDPENLGKMQKQYAELFEAFVAGVKWAREQSRKEVRR